MANFSGNSRLDFTFPSNKWNCRLRCTIAISPLPLKREARPQPHLLRSLMEWGSLQIFFLVVLAPRALWPCLTGSSLYRYQDQLSQRAHGGFNNILLILPGSEAEG